MIRFLRTGLRKMCRNQSEKVRVWRKLHNEDFIIYILKKKNISRMIKPQWMRWEETGGIYHA
jgi:hypothetical protein